MCSSTSPVLTDTVVAIISTLVFVPGCPKDFLVFLENPIIVSGSGSVLAFLGQFSQVWGLPLHQEVSVAGAIWPRGSLETSQDKAPVWRRLE